MGAALPIAGGALLGAINNHQKEARYNREKELAAQTEQYSPWTGLHADVGALNASRPNLFGNMLQGGVTGALLNQQFGDNSPQPNMAGGENASPYMYMGNPQQPNFFTPKNPYSGWSSIT